MVKTEMEVVPEIMEKLRNASIEDVKEQFSPRLVDQIVGVIREDPNVSFTRVQAEIYTEKLL